MTREPYTEPYTRRERLSIRKALLTYDVRRFFREGIWMKLAWMLPHELAKWAFIRISANVTDLPPDQITYEVAAKAWDAKRAKPAAHPGQTLIEIGAFICLVLVGVGILIYLTT